MNNNNNNIDYNLINLKCIDDFNNKLGIIIQSNINGMLKLLKIDYTINLPESKLFSNNTDDNNNNNIDNINDNDKNDNDINKTVYKKNYSKSNLFDPYD
tara:strand:+ start:1252 stop:1548 length:297 start_codon:yes stop_codon:yes gene_type:complete